MVLFLKIIIAFPFSLIFKKFRLFILRHLSFIYLYSGAPMDSLPLKYFLLSNLFQALTDWKTSGNA